LTMRWYARPEGDNHQLRVTPRLASWNKSSDPDQVRLREYLDDTESLLAASRVDGLWALRLDVGLPTGRDLLDMADLDNYAFPLACRLDDPKLVSVWCTKQHNEQSFMRIDAAQEMPPPSPEVLGVRPTSSYTTSAYKEEIYAAVAAAVAEELPAGAVRLQLSFLVGPDRKWWHLWKPTIDSLEPLLGRDASEQRAWHPLDGRITELGMHKTVDPAFRYEVEIGIAAQPAREPDTTTPGLGSASGLPLTKGKSVARKRWTVSDTCRFADAVIDNDGRDLPAEKLDALSDEVHCSRGAAETMVWRMQTVLGYPVKAAETSVLDRAVGQLFLDHDPRLRRQVNV
jgi:hypothetical protein